MPKLTVDDKYSPEDVERALKLLDQAKAAREKEQAKMKDPVYKEKLLEAGRKSVIQTSLYVLKAKEAGIVVTPEEVQKVYNKKYAGKK